MRQWTFPLLGLPLIVTLVGCNAATLTVRISPRTVAMKSVAFDGRDVREREGEYTRDLRAGKKGTTRDVRVRAESQGGVVAEATYTVTAGAITEKELRMPALLQVKIASSESDDVTVKIDNSTVTPEGGVYKTRIFMDDASRELWVWARDEATGLIVERPVNVSAGEKTNETLDLLVEAKFRANSTSVYYDKAVRFDASESTPRELLSSYTWDFGDGTEKVTTKDSVTHTYKFDPSIDRIDEFTVTLVVSADDISSRPYSRTLEVDTSEKKLVFDLDVYPRKQSFEPGESVQFKLAARGVSSPKEVVDLSLAFGDKEAPVALALAFDDGACKPNVVSHTYGEVGSYELHLTYSHNPRGPNDPQQAEISASEGSSSTITVAQRYRSDEEMVDKAWEDFYRQFDALLHDSKVSEKVLALTSLDSANYETELPKFVPVIQRLTKMLVEDDDRYFLLEKRSQVLARLAHEAVVDIRPELEGAGVDSSGGVDALPYRQYLDYGLASEHKGAQLPIEYSLKIEGTEDRIQHLRTSEQEIRGQGRLTTDGAVPEKELRGNERWPSRSERRPRVGQPGGGATMRRAPWRRSWLGEGTAIVRPRWPRVWATLRTVGP